MIFFASLFHNVQLSFRIMEKQRFRTAKSADADHGVRMLHVACEVLPNLPR